MLWTWVGDTANQLSVDGHAEAAEAVSSLPQLAAEGELARIRTGLPAALRAAREVAGRPWLRGYLEHWPLAARVGDRAEGEAARTEAEDRLRAAHMREGGCAPAACAAENVVACYANIDGPGTTADRTTLITEAMATTRPGEPAWEALVLAHASTLVDDERPDEAMRALDTRAREVTEAGADVSFDFGFGYVRALHHQDRYSDALRTLDHMEAHAAVSWPRGIPRDAAQRRIRFERARVLAWLARVGERPAEEAVAALPTLREADAHPTHRVAWVDAAENLIAVGALANDWHVGVALTTWSRYFERVGAWRPCLEVALSAARLATARGARWVAESALERAYRALGRIHRADDPAADLAETRAGVERLTAPDLGGPADQVLARLRAESPERVDPERQADLVVAALEHRPDDSALLSALGQVGRTLMLTDAAADPHWRRVRSVPGDQTTALSLLETLLHDNDTAGMRTLVQTLTGAAEVRSEPVGQR